MKSNKKKVIVSVTTDLASDQRVNKVCHSLVGMGFEVLLVGRKRKNSLPYHSQSFQSHRMKLFFEKGKFFYIEFNIRLFFFLLLRGFDLLVSNDLDTLLPNTLIHLLRKKKLVYDSHEYFTEVAELVARPKIQAIWKRIERFCFPKLKTVFTVSQSIADLYEKEYGVKVLVVRNISPQKEYVVRKTRAELGLPEDRPILLMQGSGINVNRGAEELLEAMQYIDNAMLLFIGGGDVVPQLKQRAEFLQLQQKVRFINRMPFEQLYDYTVHATLGFSLDKNISINHLYALPNKLFDFIRAGVPVIVSDMMEISKIVNQYRIGCILPNCSPETIAATVNKLLSDKDRLSFFTQNLVHASGELCWEKEEIILREGYRKAMEEKND